MTPLPLAIPMFVILLLAIACTAYWGAVWWRVARARRTLPTLRDALERPEPAGGWPSVCVVTPAHNEGAYIRKQAQTLLDQDYPGELRFVWALDRCTDDTLSKLRGIIMDNPDVAERTEVIEIDHCPDDWTGKVHAIHEGVTRSEGAARAELLLFVDADMSFHPGVVRAAVALLRERALDLLSLLCTLRYEKDFERRLQPAAGFELVRRFPLDRINRDKGGPRFANGQFMLFERAMYERIGGHAVARKALLEDLKLARRVRNKRIDGRVGVFMAGGIVRCAMYDSLDEFRRGWKRIYTEAARSRVRDLYRSAWRLRLTGVVLPVAGLVCGASGLALLVIQTDWWLGVPMVLVGLAARFVFNRGLWLIYQTQHAPIMAMGWFPVGAWRIAGILDEAARDLKRGNPTEWAGKRYAREAT